MARAQMATEDDDDDDDDDGDDDDNDDDDDDDADDDDDICVYVRYSSSSSAMCIDICSYSVLKQCQAYIRCSSSAMNIYVYISGAPAVPGIHSVFQQCHEYRYTYCYE